MSSRGDVVRTPLSLTTTTRRGRTFDEHLYVRFPGLLRHVVSAVMRLRPRSRVRQALLSLSIRRGWAASDRGDLDLCLCGYDPDVEISWPDSGGMAIPDLHGVYHGHDGYRQVWQAMHDPWDVDVQLEEMIDAGPQVLVIGQAAVRGSGSGVSVSGPLIVLQTFRAGRIVREQFFNDRAEALEAAGLSERAMSQENVDATGGVRYRISLPSERAAQRRSLDERLFVRFPVLYSWIAGAVARLAPEHRLRRFMLARSASRTVAAVNRRDFTVLFLALDPEIEYLPAGDERPPGMDPVSHGYDGYEWVWRQMIDSFEDFRAEPEELFDLGDVLLATVRYTGHGSGSGVPIEVPLAQLFRLRKGMIVWQQDFSDRAKAFEAAGLSE